MSCRRISSREILVDCPTFDAARESSRGDGLATTMRRVVFPSVPSRVCPLIRESFCSLADGGLIFTASSMLVFLAREKPPVSLARVERCCLRFGASLSSSRELNLVFGSTMSVSTSYRVRTSRGDIRHLLKEGGKWLRHANRVGHSLKFMPVLPL